MKNRHVNVMLKKAGVDRPVTIKPLVDASQQHLNWGEVVVIAGRTYLLDALPEHLRVLLRGVGL